MTVLRAAVALRLRHGLAVLFLCVVTLCAAQPVTAVFAEAEPKKPTSHVASDPRTATTTPPAKTRMDARTRHEYAGPWRSSTSQITRFLATKAGAGPPNRIYSARELRRRAAEPGPYHNFPGSFDDEIFERGTRTVTPGFFKKPRANLSNDSVQYRLRGEINNRSGTYEVFARPSQSGRTGGHHAPLLPA